MGSSDQGSDSELEEDDPGFETIDIESRQTSRDRSDSDDMTHPFDRTSDCFDDFDGRAVFEPEDVKERRLDGNSSLIEQVKSFDSRAVFYSSLFLFEWLIFIWWPPLFLAFCLVVVLPLVLFYFWWSSLQKECALATVVHALGRGFYDVTAMMVCASYGALIIGLMVLYWMWDVFKKNDEKSRAFVFYICVFVPFVVSEEYFKAMFVRLQQRKLEASCPDAITRAHLVHSTATSVGYALSQAMGWVVIAHVTFMSNDVYIDDTLRQVWSLLLVGICVTAFGTPLQLLSGYLIGLEVTRNTWEACGPSLLVPTALRATYYVSAVGWLLLVDSVATAVFLFFLTNVLICGLMLLRVKQVEALMPASYLRRVGYLNWGGYGVLDITDDDGDDGTGINSGVNDELPLHMIRSAKSKVDAGVEMTSLKTKPMPNSTIQTPAPSATRNSVLARLEALKAKSANKAVTPVPAAKITATTSDSLHHGDRHGEVDGDDDDVAVL